MLEEVVDGEKIVFLILTQMFGMKYMKKIIEVYYSPNFLPSMVKNKWGRVIAIGSVWN